VPKHWKILDRGTVPELAKTISYGCPHCHTDAELPVVGVAIAQIEAGVVFDPGPNAMPYEVQCTTCGHRFQLEVPA